MAEFASKGVAGTGLGLGAAALGVEVLNGGVGKLLGNLMGGNCNSGDAAAAIMAAIAPMLTAAAITRPDCGGHGYGRYDAEKDAEIAELRTEVKLRDANTYTMGEVNKLRDYMERRFDRVEGELCEQKAYNATNTATLSCMGQQISGIQGVLAAITKTVVSKDAICPEVMPRYNSWTPPTETQTTGA